MTTADVAKEMFYNLSYWLFVYKIVHIDQT